MALVSVWGTKLKPQSGIINTQESSFIPIMNGSFEKAIPEAGIIPMGWDNCGSTKETPPDVLAHNEENIFKVKHSAADGLYFMSLVVRSNGTTECIQQELFQSLSPGQLYEMSFQVAKADRFEAIERRSMELASFAHPVMLEIYGITTEDKRILLADIPPVTHQEWQKKTVQFQPESTIKSLQISPFYNIDSLYQYNGHILLDGLSNIFILK